MSLREYVAVEVWCRASARRHRGIRQEPCFSLPGNDGAMTHGIELPPAQLMPDLRIQQPGGVHPGPACGGQASEA